MRLLTLSLLLATASLGCSRAADANGARYDRAEVSIPMRDGTRLFAVTLTPRGVTAPLPILLIRTPFGASQEFPGPELPAAYRELGADGYIFVMEDIRGRSRSGGAFVVNRPLADSGGTPVVDESTDAWDTIEWLVHHLPNTSGKVGVLGSSYRGWLAAMAGVHPHPALRAISPQAPTGDTWLGDDFFHQGAFRETQGVEWTAYADGKADPRVPENDQYAFYLKQQVLSAIGTATGVAQLPSWRAFAEHPAYDGYWQSRALQRVDAHATVPTLIVGGWWDQEDAFGPQALYRAMAANDTNGYVHLVLGPWSHNAWTRPHADSVGPIALGSNTAQWFREHVQRPWFAWYLHGIGDGHFARAILFQTGQNRWDTLEAWPPTNAKSMNLYLAGNGHLLLDSLPAALAGDSGYTSYPADPASPVPYLPRDRDGSGWQTWLMQDQRFLGPRPDVQQWRSNPLDQDVVVAGDVAAHLLASTSGTDADWVVKLIDVFPDSGGGSRSGYELMVNADIMRGRYWQGFEHATPITAGRVTPFDVDLHQQYYRFAKGHQIMVEVQSSWFPLYDRNPQTFVPNIFEAGPGDFRPAEQRIWHTKAFPSHVTMQVLP
jgi:putative CocE/NonD family hydrolase